MMEVEMQDMPAKCDANKSEEENLYNKLQELNKYLEFLSIQEDYIKEDQIKLKRYHLQHVGKKSGPRKNSNASKPSL